MVDVIFRKFLDFDGYIGTPIDIMHNMESGCLKDMLEVSLNRICKLFAAFVAVYMALRQMRFSEDDLSVLHSKLQVLHR